MSGEKVNTPGYWNERFVTGDWDAKGGPAQTRFFAELALSTLSPLVIDDIRRSGATVCDWGCAEGDGTALLGARWGVPVTGIDVAPAAVERARERNPGVAFVPSADGLERAVDVLFTSNTLEHFSEPWRVLERLLRMVRRYAIIVVPFEERDRIEEHQYTFEWDSFPLRLRLFELVDLRVIDCAAMPGSMWPGQQAIATYAHSRAEAVPLRLDATIAALLARAAALETARRSAETARVALQSDRDRLAAEVRTGTQQVERLRQQAESWASRLEFARVPRSYAVGRAFAALKKDPVGTVRATAGWALLDRGRGVSLHEVLRAPDPLLEAATGLRAVVAGEVRQARHADAEYRRELGKIAERCSEPADRVRRRRHATAVSELERRAAASRGAVVYLPVLNWGYLRQRPQQVMSELARRGYVCVFCSQNPADDDVDGLREVEPNVFLCSDVRLAFGLERPVLWVTWAPNAAYAPFFRRPRLVYEYIDDLQLFHLYSQEMERHHAELLRDADVVVASADRLLASVRDVRADAVLAPNGVRPEEFVVPAGAPVPGDLAAVLAAGRPIVGYYGALARWFDYDLLNAVSRSGTDLSFVLIGPDYDGSLARLERRPNVFLLGQKPYAELAAYSRRFDAAMIPFEVNDITQSTSPVKLFEYMAAGAPIVTTPMYECRKYRSVTIASTPDEFLTALRGAVGKRSDPEYQALLAREVAENTWADRVERILASLEPERRDSAGEVPRVA